MAKKLFFHFLLFLFLCNLFATAIPYPSNTKKNAIIVKAAIDNEKLTTEWKDALVTRMSKERIDSFGSLQRPLSNEETAWKKNDRIQSRCLE